MHCRTICLTVLCIFACVHLVCVFTLCRTGEFRVTVTVSNLVSSASLSSHIFVVDRPCQPPPVKNMGPLKLQVRFTSRAVTSTLTCVQYTEIFSSPLFKAQRHEVIRLGVTFETEVDCDISGGLHYTWTLFDSAGRVFPLPLIDTHRHSLILPSHLLHYDTYTAIARVSSRRKLSHIDP